MIDGAQPGRLARLLPRGAAPLVEDAVGELQGPVEKWPSDSERDELLGDEKDLVGPFLKRE